MTGSLVPGATVLPGEPEWSDDSLAAIFARYAAPLPPRPQARWQDSPAARGRLAEKLVPVAAALAGIVHGDGDVNDVAKLIGKADRRDWPALMVVLAAGWDLDRTTGEVLGWTELPPGDLAPCGSRSAKRRHRRAGEGCVKCWPPQAEEATAPPKKDVAA